MTVEKTFVMIKPDGVQRGIVGELVSRFEKAGLKLVGMKMIHVDEEFAKKHYHDVEERHGEKIFMDLVRFITSGPVIAFVLEGVGAISLVRKMVGKTEPASAEPGTIRGDYTHMNYARADGLGVAIMNVIHASADEKDSKHEISHWFSESELVEYETAQEKFM